MDWLVRSDFRGLLEPHPEIERVLVFERKAGLGGLIKLAWELGSEPYTHVYDAHANVRSTIVMWVLRFRKALRVGGPRFQWRRRPKHRLRRLLFFRLRIRSALPQPFRGAVSFLAPLRPWGIPKTPPAPPQFFLSEQGRTEARQVFGNFRPDIILIPSAAWEMKRWPLEHWKRLIELLPTASFAVLGGPEDEFCRELEQLAPERVRNFAGQLSLPASSAALELSKLAISGDTGLLHVADQIGHPCLALIGPTAFGYPAHLNSQTVENQLPCKPCSKDGRGRCSNTLYKRCLIELRPERIAKLAQEILTQESLK